MKWLDTQPHTTDAQVKSGLAAHNVSLAFPGAQADDFQVRREIRAAMQAVATELAGTRSETRANGSLGERLRKRFAKGGRTSAVR